MREAIYEKQVNRHRNNRTPNLHGSTKSNLHLQGKDAPSKIEKVQIRTSYISQNSFLIINKK